MARNSPGVCFGFSLWLAIFAGSSHAAPNINGETGYINMPSGRVEADGTFRMGYSFAEPYSSIWTSISLLPRVEFSGRFTRILSGAIGGGSPIWQGYGDYKDKVINGKAVLFEEDWFMPSLALGIHDVQGTGLFVSKYLAASKRFGPLDATLGFGSGRIDGLFAGARYAPREWDGFALAAEYDANNYKQDLFSTQTGIAQRQKGIGLALEYRWGWMGSQLSLREGKPGINAYASIPLEMREFIPKLDEPAPDAEAVERPTLKQWDSDSSFRSALIERLLLQDFRNIRLRAEADVMEVTLTNIRISLPSRAVGRAVRSILLRAPLETREIVIHYTVSGLPFSSYRFTDTNRLQQYFNGMVSRKQLAETVRVDYAQPQQWEDREALLDSVEEGFSQSSLDGNDGDMVSFRRQGGGLDKFRIAPGMSIFFNDPSGAFHYEVFANASYEKQMADRLFLKTTAQLMINQDISKTRPPTPQTISHLPHVRTDVQDYKKNGNIKLTQLLVNRFFHPGQHLYVRASGGLYEEMFGGAGGQILYYPERASWAFDMNVDALKQRDVGGGFSFRNYSTMTALAAMHYRLPVTGLTATVRAGRFLAKDIGGRFELKRRFRSGFEAGAWYTLTNGNDITGPGKPGRPYHDKGIFMSIPLETMLTKDTQANSRMSLAIWTRDVGQMVASPGDLYDMMEPAHVNMHDRDGLQYFGDLDDSYEQPRDLTALDRIRWANWADDRRHTVEGLISVDTWLKVGAGLGISVLSSVMDKPADRWAVRHKNGSFSKAIVNVGNNLPLLMGGVAGLLALDGSDERMSATSFTALEAGVASVLAVEAGKYVFGRSRPQAGLGNRKFRFAGASNGASSFPSGHTTAMWAMATSYAREYHAPWLYGLAAVTNAARVADRKHWVSDTVGGALLGYAIGDAFWRWHHGGTPALSVDGEGVMLTWRTDY